MTKNLLLGSIAGNFLPVEDRQRCAKPARFAQGTSGGLGLYLVADYPRELASTVAAVNDAGKGRQRLRVRLAIHHGAVAPGRFGPVGAAPVVISRLVDAEPVKQQLRQRSDLNTALIVSACPFTGARRDTPMRGGG